MGETQLSITSLVPNFDLALAIISDKKVLLIVKVSSYHMIQHKPYVDHNLTLACFMSVILKLICFFYYKTTGRVNRKNFELKAELCCTISYPILKRSSSFSPIVF